MKRDSASGEKSNDDVDAKEDRDNDDKLLCKKT